MLFLLFSGICTFVQCIPITNVWCLLCLNMLCLLLSESLLKHVLFTVKSLSLARCVWRIWCLTLVSWKSKYSTSVWMEYNRQWLYFVCNLKRNIVASYCLFTLNAMVSSKVNFTVFYYFKPTKSSTWMWRRRRSKKQFIWIMNRWTTEQMTLDSSELVKIDHGLHMVENTLLC